MGFLDWFTIVVIVVIVVGAVIAYFVPPKYIRNRDGTIVPNGTVLESEQCSNGDRLHPCPAAYDWPCDEFGKPRASAPRAPKQQ